MAERIRGKEVDIRVAVDGVLRSGLFKNVTEWEVTPRDELPETELIGKDETSLDFLHSGWDLSWTGHTEDSDSINFMDEIVELQRQRVALPRITISFLFRFRDESIPDRQVVYRGCKMKIDREGVSGRTEYLETAYSAKAEKRTTMNL